MLPFTRWLSLVIVPFLLVAFVILYLFPTRTGRLWAWQIPATMTSMVLASAYLGGAYFFLRVQRERRWHRIGRGYPAVATFAGLLGIATLLHWDRFLHDHLAFWLWAGLYFTAPFAVLGAWIANRRHAIRPGADEVMLRPGERAAVVVLGVLALGQGLVMFLAPSAVIGQWPWPLTPLTCQVMGAVFCLGCAGIGSWWDPRWSSVRLMIEVDLLMLTLMLVAAARAHDEMIAGRAYTWPLLVGCVLTIAGSAYLWASHELHRPLPAPTG
ncbi:hypothetical protein JCM18899A_36080 [Nocardioides sp. AN3]